MSETITKVDDFFKKLYEVSAETKRWLVGRYSTEQNHIIDFEKSIPIYKGPEVCHHQFDFTTDSPRCMWCNSLCLLTKEGNFENGDIIPIKSGSFKGQEIKVNKYPVPTIPFGRYETIQPQVKSDMNVIRNVCKRQWLQNKSDDVSHDIAISCILNSFNYPFRSTTLAGWICKDINLIKLVPTLGSLKNAVFTVDLFKNTIFTLYMLSMIGVFSHGDPNANVMYLSNIPSSFDVGQKKIQMTSTLFMDMSEFSSYMMDYDKRFFYFTGKQHEFKTNEPDFNYEFTLTDNKLVPRQHTKSPSKKSYLTSRMTTFIPSIEMMNYIRKTGINISPQLYYMIYMTIVLLNVSFYDIYRESSIKEVFSKIFLNDEYQIYMNMISKHLGETPTCDEIITMLANAKIHIRDDSLDMIKSDMVSYISNK